MLTEKASSQGCMITLHALALHMVGFSGGRKRVGVSGVGNQLAYFQNNHKYILVGITPD